jgi:AcrR family transcriptional regulator
LDGITIGGLADKIGMSKSGVFAHFGSRDDLQKATLRAYSAYFADVVLRTAIAEPRGLPRLVAIFNRWAELVSTEGKGCILISSASEFDDRPGAIRDELIYWVTAWQKELYTAIMQSIQCHHLPETIDIEQLVFELYGLILILHHDARLLRSANSLSRAKAGLKRLLASYAS